MDVAESARNAYAWRPIASALLLLLATALVRAFWAIRPFRVPPTVPGPRRYPIIGFLWHPIRHWSRWPSETRRLSEEYGRTWGGPVPNLGSLPGAYFYIFEEENLRHILQDSFDNYGKGDMWTNVLGELLGKGIFAVDGEGWRVHRKLMSNMFSRNLLRHSAGVTKRKLFEVVDLFEEKLRNLKYPEEGFDVDIQDVFFRLTIDLAAKVAFDVELDSIANQEQHGFARAFDELSSLCQKRFVDPLFQIKRSLQLTRQERQIRELKRIVDGFAADVIRSRRRSAEEKSVLGPDILSRFIDHAQRSGEYVSDVELRDVIMNVILAGRDTTACALSWTFYELTRNPDAAARVAEEVEAICGAGDGADYSYDAACRLRYAHAVALESLRLHPPVPIDPRFAVREDTLPDGTHIPAGSGHTLLFYAMGRSKKIWGEDANQFRPERFLEEKEPSPFKYPVFNAGPRMCLGKPLALMNMKLAMSILLPRFNFEDKSNHLGEYQWTLVQAMKDGFPVNVSQRKAKLLS